MNRSKIKTTGQCGLAAAISIALTVTVNAQDVDLTNLGDAGVKLTGAGDEDLAGFSVSGAGDFNGDGYGDLLVGAPYALQMTGLVRNGSAYVVFGGPQLSDRNLGSLGTSGLRMREFTLERTGFGNRTASIGDFNGDGLDDVIVTTSQRFENSPGSRPVWIVFGRSTSSDLLVESNGNTIRLGGMGGNSLHNATVAGAGDVNGDGLADIVISARRPDDDDAAAYVVFGKQDLDDVDLENLGDAGFVIRSPQLRPNTSYSMLTSGAGDMNGDGLADILIGTSVSQPDDVQAYAVFGRTNADDIDLQTLGNSGFSIKNDSDGPGQISAAAAAGDVNGDGLGDIILGVRREAIDGPYSSGSTYVVFGSTSPSPIDLASLRSGSGGGFRITGGMQMNARFGSSVTGAGDVNGDGLSDVVVGTHPIGSYAGTNHIVFGRAETAAVDTSQPGFGGRSTSAAEAGMVTRSNVSGAGDVTGDGLSDIIIGAPKAGGDTIEPGAAYVVFSQETPLLESTYRGYARNGDAPRMGVGATGDGSDDFQPNSRAWIDFRDGNGVGAPASLHEVTLTRSSAPFTSAVASVRWQIQSARNGWTTAEVKFKYLDGELFGAGESFLTLYQAPSPNGPYTALASTVDSTKNTISATVDSFGYFYIGEDTSDQIFASGFE